MAQKTPAKKEYFPRSPRKSPANAVIEPALKSAIKVSDLPGLKKQLGILIAIVSFLLYAQSISFRYTLDDGTVIKENKVIKKGFAGIPTIIKTGYWYGFNDSNDAAYRPVSLVMFAIEWQCFPDNPYVNHLLNVILYALTCFLLFQLLCKLLNEYNVLLPFAATMLFAFHPIHTEVVSSIKSRDEIMCLLFLVISGLSLLKIWDNQNANRNLPLHAIIAAVCFMLALLSKETAITFVLVFPLMFLSFRKIDKKKLFYLGGSLILMAGIYLFMRSQILETVTTARKLLPIDNTLMDAKDASGRYATAIMIMGRYVGLLFFPHPLSYDYSFKQISIVGFGDASALFSVLLFVGLFIFAIIRFRQNPITSFSIFFFLFTMAIVSNIFLIIGATLAERLLYIPSIGFSLIIAAGLMKLMKVDLKKNTITSFSGIYSKHSSLTLIVVVILLAYSVKTISRSADWKDNIALFESGVKASPNSARTHYNYASMLLLNLAADEKDKEKKNSLLRKSIGEFQKAVSIFQIYPDAYLNMALAYTYLEDNTSAIAAYEMAKKMYPKPNAKVYNNLGFLYGKTGQFDKAIELLTVAIKITPDFEEAYNNMGNALSGKQRYEESIPQFQKAIELNPRYAEAYKNLGSTYGNMTRYDSALICFKKSVELNEKDEQTYAFIGMTYNMTHDSINGKRYMRMADSVAKLSNNKK